MDIEINGDAEIDNNENESINNCKSRQIFDKDKDLRTMKFTEYVEGQNKKQQEMEKQNKPLSSRLGMSNSSRFGFSVTHRIHQNL